MHKTFASSLQGPPGSKGDKGERVSDAQRRMFMFPGNETIQPMAESGAGSGRGRQAADCGFFFWFPGAKRSSAKRMKEGCVSLPVAALVSSQHVECVCVALPAAKCVD